MSESPETARQDRRALPLSWERLLDYFCWSLAAWTLLCNLVVDLGGSLEDLFQLSLLLLLGSALLLGWRERLRRRFPGWWLPPKKIATEGNSQPPQRPLWNKLLVGPLPVLLMVGLATKMEPQLLWLIALAYLLINLLRSGPHESPQGVEPRPHAFAFWGLVALMMAFSLIAHRPDLDDAYYMNLAVNAADQPDRPLLCCDTLHDREDKQPHPGQRLRSLELFEALLTYITGIPPIRWSHHFLPLLGSFLTVAAYGRLYRLLVPARWLLSLATTVVILLTIGGAPMWYGNLGFVRLQQGKGLFASAIIPLLIVYGLEFARGPNLRRWLRLLATQIASIGLNSTALWVAPAVVGLAILSGLSWRRRSLLVLLWGIPSSVYLLWRASLVGPQVLDFFEISTVGKSSQDLMQLALEQVLGAGLLPAAAFLCTALAWWFCRPGLARRFCLIFPLGFLIVLFNPFTARWVANHATSVYAYWRVFWVLPIPVFMTLCLTAPLGFRGFMLPAWVRGATAVGLTAAFVWWVPQQHLLSSKNDVFFKPFSLKVPEAYTLAKILVEGVPPGSRVVAPAAVSPWVVTFSRHPYPMVVRRQYLMRYLGTVENQRRMRMTRFVNGGKAKSWQAENFLRDVDRTQTRGVCFRRRLNFRGWITSGLKDRGFERIHRNKVSEIWVLPEHIAREADGVGHQIKRRAYVRSRKKAD